MPYKDDRLRKEYQDRLYKEKKHKLTRPCPSCFVRTVMVGKTCRNCSKSQQGINWVRKTALIRDNYTCQICGIREIGLVEVDHILTVKDRPDLYTTLSNLMVLCPNCHKRKTVRERKKNE